ncbi:chromosome partitioning protein [Paracoccus tegillarcae]|uniref:Chromosome partitioning protein n=1 Tax=Paracoccus tegillarcae TaxID=1529068 RepID=A0A2K9ELJ3_9RHOB|nr:chromosome partitioning protein [Paracoccus tegillarcae]AUH34297.1 chromosome partitioning protein [Paracoccus tegillarcae]
MDIGGRFSVLRTRLLQEMGRQGARRLGVCPISDGAGATYVAANLALATARLSHLDVLLVDLALGHPTMGVQLGLSGHPDFVPYLRGDGGQASDLMMRIESEGNLNCLLPDRPTDRGAEILQDERARERIGQLVESSDCDIAIFDLSPVLRTDEGLAALPMMDAILLVADGRAGTGRDVADCQRLMADMPPLLGVVLNKAELLG